MLCVCTRANRGHALLRRRTIVRADKCLLFEPNSPCSRKFLDIVCPRLQDHETARRARAQRLLHQHGGLEALPFPEDEERAPPFELEVLEAALMVATGARRCCSLAATLSGAGQHTAPGGSAGVCMRDARPCVAHFTWACRWQPRHAALMHARSSLRQLGFGVP